MPDLKLARKLTTTWRNWDFLTALLGWRKSDILAEKVILRQM
jgi:hypothetical protein